MKIALSDCELGFAIANILILSDMNISYLTYCAQNIKVIDLLPLPSILSSKLATTYSRGHLQRVFPPTAQWASTEQESQSRAGEIEQEI